MTVVDGLINEGEVPKDHIEEKDNIWENALTRFFVNYTIDGKNWVAYRNGKGDIQVRLIGLC